MYISGHLEILNELLTYKQLSNYFNSTGKFSSKNLFKGITVVDLPCDNYIIKNNHVFSNPKICKMIQLLDLFKNSKNETTIWQRHKGYFAHLHSMTTDPNNTVEMIRNKIIMSILGYSLLALYDNNVFDKNPVINPNSIWIGIVLHIITDSYSMSHTIRNKNIKTKTYNRGSSINEDVQMQIKVHENIKDISKMKSIYPSINSFINKLLNIKRDGKSIEYIKSKKGQLFDSYKEFKLEFEMNKLVKSHIKINNIRDKDNYGDLVNFQYYETQPSLLHSKLDFLVYLKKDERMYQRMMNECIDYLLLFKKVLYGDINTDTFLRELLIFLLSRTYCIKKIYLKEKTNKIYNDIEYLDIKYLKENLSLSGIPGFNFH